MDLSGGFLRKAQRLPASVILGRAKALAAQWEAEQRAGPAINDCADRADFASLLLASSLRSEPCLLPPSSAPQAFAQLRERWPQAFVLQQLPPLSAPSDDEPPTLEGLASRSFTSGSTGLPQPVDKSWKGLLGLAECIRQLSADWGLEQPEAVATVPPQHTFGLEFSVVMPLFAGWWVACERPFHVPEVASSLQQLSRPGLLITTPVHLRTLLASTAKLPPLQMVLSATAPLSLEEARQAELSLGCPLREIYGCTETGGVATRRTVEGPEWTLMPGLQFGNSGLLQGAHLPPDSRLPDRLEILGAQRFRLLGRPEGMLKLGGKRSSVQAVQQALLSIPGVLDAEVGLLPGRERPAALVQAPELGAAQIRQALAERIDPVFIPRPLRLQPGKLPRNSTGKLTRAAFEAAFKP